MASSPCSPTLPPFHSQTPLFQWNSVSDSNDSDLDPINNDLNQTDENNQSPNHTNLLKISGSLEKEFGLNPEVSLETVKKACDQQKILAKWQAKSIPASNTFDCECVLTSQRMHFIRRKVGAGTYTDVFQATVIATEQHEVGGVQFSPSNPKVMALKRKKATTTFSPEKRQLEQAVKEKAGTDYFLDTFKEIHPGNKFRGYSMNVLYDACLTKALFHQMKNPVISILRTLISSTQGLTSFHEKGFIHRDIKGGNILVLTEENSSTEPPLLSSSSIAQVKKRNATVGVISDFDFLIPKPSAIHTTIGTPEYLDPSMFGTEEMSVYNQKIRRGMQTPAGDVFALGVTVEKDVLRSFIKYISIRTPVEKVVDDLMNEIQPKIIKGKYTEEDLKKIGKESRFRVIYREIKTANPMEKLELLIYRPQIDLICKNLKAACLQLEGILSPEEIAVLSQLAELSCRMQEVDLSLRPTIQQVQRELTGLLDRLQPSEAINKRPREDAESDSNSQRNTKRRRKLEEETGLATTIAESNKSATVAIRPSSSRRQLFCQKDV